MKKIYAIIALFVSAFVLSGIMEFVLSHVDYPVAQSLGPIPVAAQVASLPTPLPTVKTVAQADHVAPVEAPNTGSGSPVQLIIPAARVDATVIPVGVTADNHLDVPPNYVQVGWYKDGIRPGDNGSAVLDGHVDNGYSMDGVFKHLRDLKSGDDIYLKSDNGQTKHFIVRESKAYALADFPSDLVFNDKSGSLLKIITCHGTFVPAQNTYDQRLIVTAVLAN